MILARQIWAAAGTKKRRAVSRAAFGLLCVPGAMQRFFSAASQNRDRTEHQRSYGPGSAAAPLRKCYALRCVRGTSFVNSQP
jgi:hypothetical protein